MTFEQAIAACDELEHLVESGPGWDEVALTRCWAILDEFVSDLRIRGYARRKLNDLERWFRVFLEDDPLRNDPSQLLKVLLRKDLSLFRDYVVRAFRSKS
jgi:hypothetical protein